MGDFDISGKETTVIFQGHHAQNQLYKPPSISPILLIQTAINPQLNQSTTVNHKSSDASLRVFRRPFAARRSPNQLSAHQSRSYLI